MKPVFKPINCTVFTLISNILLVAYLVTYFYILVLCLVFAALTSLNHRFPYFPMGMYSKWLSQS